MGDLLFGEAHWLLAWYYMKLSQSHPRMIARQETQVKDYRLVLWIGVVCNALFPLLEIGVYTWRTIASYSTLTSIVYLVTKTLTQLSWVVSGSILIWAVFNIRSVMNSEAFEGKGVDTKTLVIHASAFGLFAVSALANISFYDRWVIEGLLDPDGSWKKTGSVQYFIANALFWICSFVSQCLLC